MGLNQTQIEILMKVIGSENATRQLRQVANEMGNVFRNTGTMMDNAGTKLIAWGKNTQWLGRQLLYNITLPLIGIGVVAVKAALEIEKQWVRVQKVYGDTAEEVKNFAKVKTDILIPAVEKLSVRFAEHKQVVIEVMSEWAAMGKTGQELADITEETFRVMKLGELDLADATNTIRTLMATYGLSVKDVAKELNAFNTIENTTSLRFKDLVQAIPEVVAVFKSFNITAREGASLLAGMHERGLDAKESAHALKFTLTRLQSPTKQAAELFKKYNFEIFDSTGKMKDGIPVIKELAKKLNEMTDEEQAVFISTAAGRRQFVRFKQALESTLDPASAFSRAMEASADDVGNAENAQRELNTILESGPVKVQRLLVEMKNLAAELGEKLLPYLLKGMEYAKGIFDWFDKLSPSTKDWAIKIALVTAALGPFLIFIASAAEVLGVLFKAGGKLIKVTDWILKVAKVLTKWTWTFIKIVAKAVWAGIKIAAQAIKAAAEWIAQAIATAAKWTWAFIKMVAKAVWTGIKFVANAIIAGATWVAQAVVASVAWTAAFIKMVAKAYWAGLSQTSPALASGLIWAKNAVVASAAWVANFIIMIAKAIAAGVVMAAQAVISGAKWVAQAILAGAEWVAQFIIMVAKAIWTGIKMAAQAILAAAEWIAQPVIAAVAWVAQFAIMVAEAVVTGVKMAANAVIAGAAWVWQAVKAAAAWIAEFIIMLPFNAGAATGIAANAVIAGTAWITQAQLVGIAWAGAMGAIVAVTVISVVLILNELGKLRKEIDAIYGSISSLDDQYNRIMAKDWKDVERKQKAIDYLRQSRKEYEKGIPWWQRRIGLQSGGIIPEFPDGGFVKAATGLVAGASALQDRVPALLTPGEIVLNKRQQELLLKGGTGSTIIKNYNVEIKAGTMIATKGEQREYVRMIKKLLSEDDKRYAY